VSAPSAFPQALADFFDPSPVGIFAIDREGLIVYVNPKQCENSRLTRDDLVGKNYRAFFYETLKSQHLLDHFDRLYQGGVTFDVTIPDYRRHADGTLLALSVKGYQHGGYTFILTIIERALQRQQQALYALAHDLARSVDIRTMADHLFAQTQSLLGAAYGFLLLADAGGNELRGVAACGIDDEAFRQERIAVREELASVVQAFQQKQPVVIADVAHSPLVSKRLRAQYSFLGSVWVVPLMSGAGAVGVFAVGYAAPREATAEELQFLQLLGDEAALAIERARLIEELRESEKRYRGLFENANDAIVTLTIEGIVTSVNRGLEVVLGWSRKELIGEHYRKLTTPAAVAVAEERIRRTLAGERLPSIFETEMVRKDGSVVPIEGRTRLVRSEEGMLIGFQGIYRDISAKKALEQQRAEFLAMLTHDIKNPLTAVLGYVDLLDEETVGRRSAVEDDFLRRLKDNALTIHALVANYLDFAKVEAGSLVLHKTPQAVGPILQRAVEQYTAAAQRRRLTLELELPAQELPLVAVDAMALERVFANLVQNAIKFTPETGRVTISVRWCTDGREEIMVAVQDTGPGIAPEELPALFRKYQRAAATRHHEGTGLGLFIVKTLVEAHGGRVEVESSLGSGTCFRVFLPTASTP
jgi:PAS domain S-box-containing protein